MGFSVGTARQKVVLQKFGQPVKPRFNPFLDSAGCTIVMRRRPSLKSNFPKTKLFFWKPCRGTVDIFCKHLSPGDESACHPNPESLRQVERNPFNANATILANDRYQISGIQKKLAITGTQ
jgi:hypothetical protein